MADADPFANWPVGRNRMNTPAHVHAFGMIALNAALLEEMLLLLLITYLPVDRETAIKLVHDLNNSIRADWLRALVRNTEANPRVLEWMDHALRCCSICFDNRNMLIHALYTGTDDAAEKMRLTKRASNNPIRDLKFEVSVDDLRKIADEIGDTVNHMMELWYLKTHTDHRALSHIALREKPPQPSRLKIPPPEANP